MKSYSMLYTIIFFMIFSVSQKNDTIAQSYGKLLAKAANTPVRAVKTLLTMIAEVTDTSKMEVRKTGDIVIYKIDFTDNDPMLIKAQKAFINSSGFKNISDHPRLIDQYRNNTPNYQSKISTDPADNNAHGITFEKADEKYKAFISLNSKNLYIDIFKQNTSTLIIRTYLLDNSLKNKELAFYVNELITSHSQNYALMYLALTQLKGYLTAVQLNNYKQMVANDPIAIAYRQHCRFEHDKFIEKAAHAKGIPAQMDSLNAAVANIPNIKGQFFLNKIKNI